MELHERAERAADLIATAGHTKGILRDPVTGSHCYMGALIGIDAGVDPSGLTWTVSIESYDQVDRVASVTAELLGLPHSTRSESWREVVRWNNAPERTAAEVEQALRDAAAVLTPADAIRVPAPELTSV